MGIYACYISIIIINGKCKITNEKVGVKCKKSVRKGGGFKSPQKV